MSGCCSGEYPVLATGRGRGGGCYAGISHSWHSCLRRGWERCKTAWWQGAGTHGRTECPLKAGALASLGTSSSMSPWCEHRRWVQLLLQHPSLSSTSSSMVWHGNACGDCFSFFFLHSLTERNEQGQCYTVVVFPPGQSEVLGVSLLQVLGLSPFTACRGFVAFSMKPTRRSPMGRWKEGEGDALALATSCTRVLLEGEGTGREGDNASGHMQKPGFEELKACYICKISKKKKPKKRACFCV